jgi:HD-like signal output (HDOD) protein
MPCESTQPRARHGGWGRFQGEMLTLAPFRSSTRIARILEVVGELPTSARLLPQLQRLLNNPTASTADMVDLLRFDPTLTAKVIALSNRAFFSGGRQCATLDDSVQRLGFAEIYRLVAAVAVEGVFNQEMPLYGMAEGALLDDSLAVAVMLPILNREATVAVRGDELFTIGLLHGLGKLVLSIYAGRQGEKRKVTEDHLRNILKTERRLFRVDNPEIAAVLLERWQFASGLVRIVRHQYEPENAGGDAPAAALLHLGLRLLPYLRDLRLQAENARNLPEVIPTGIDPRCLPGLIERSRDIYDLFARRK